MGLNRFMHGMEVRVSVEEALCQMDCCDSEDDYQGHEEATDHESDHKCPPGCACGCCFHLTAIHYQFMSLPGADVQTYHYGQLHENYQFDYFIPLLQPPRLG